MLMPTLTDIAVIAFATSSMVAILQQDPRLENWRVYWQTTPYFMSRLLRCSFCSSYWCAALSTCLTGLHWLEPDLLLAKILYSWMVVLAVARMCQLLEKLETRSTKEDTKDDTKPEWKLASEKRDKATFF